MALRYGLLALLVPLCVAFGADKSDPKHAGGKGLAPAHGLKLLSWDEYRLSGGTTPFFQTKTLTEANEPKKGQQVHAAVEHNRLLVEQALTFLRGDHSGDAIVARFGDAFFKGVVAFMSVPGTDAKTLPGIVGKLRHPRDGNLLHIVKDAIEGAVLMEYWANARIDNPYHPKSAKSLTPEQAALVDLANHRMGMLGRDAKTTVLSPISPTMFFERTRDLFADAKAPDLVSGLLKKHLAEYGPSLSSMSDNERRVLRGWLASNPGDSSELGRSKTLLLYFLELPEWVRLTISDQGRPLLGSLGEVVPTQLLPRLEALKAQEEKLRASLDSHAVSKVSFHELETANPWLPGPSRVALASLPRGYLKIAHALSLSPGKGSGFPQTLRDADREALLVRADAAYRKKQLAAGDLKQAVGELLEKDDFVAQLGTPGLGKWLAAELTLVKQDDQELAEISPPTKRLRARALVLAQLLHRDAPAIAGAPDGKTDKAAPRKLLVETFDDVLGLVRLEMELLKKDSKTRTEPASIEFKNLSPADARRIRTFLYDALHETGFDFGGHEYELSGDHYWDLNRLGLRDARYPVREPLQRFLAGLIGRVPYGSDVAALKRVPGYEPFGTPPTVDSIRKALGKNTERTKHLLERLLSPTLTWEEVGTLGIEKLVKHYSGKDLWQHYSATSGEVTTKARESLRGFVLSGYAEQMRGAQAAYASLDPALRPESFLDLQSLDAALLQNIAESGGAHHFKKMFRVLAKDIRPGEPKLPVEVAHDGYGNLAALQAWSLKTFRGAAAKTAEEKEADVARAILFELASRSAMYRLHGTSKGESLPIASAAAIEKFAVHRAGLAKMPALAKRVYEAMIGQCPRWAGLPWEAIEPFAQLPAPHLKLLDLAHPKLDCERIGRLLRDPSPDCALVTGLRADLPEREIFGPVAEIVGRFERTVTFFGIPLGKSGPYTIDELLKLTPVKREEMRSNILKRLHEIAGEESLLTVLARPGTGEAQALVYLMQYVDRWNIHPRNLVLVLAGVQTAFAEGKTNPNEIWGLHWRPDNIVRDFAAEFEIWRAATPERQKLVSENAAEADIDSRPFTPAFRAIALGSQWEAGNLDDAGSNLRTLALLTHYAPEVLSSVIAPIAKGNASPNYPAFIDALTENTQLHINFFYNDVGGDFATRGVNLAKNKIVAEKMIARIEKNAPPLTNGDLVRLFDVSFFYLSHFGETLRHRWARQGALTKDNAVEFFHKKAAREDLDRIRDALRRDLEVRVFLSERAQQMDVMKKFAPVMAESNPFARLVPLFLPDLKDARVLSEQELEFLAGLERMLGHPGKGLIDATRIHLDMTKQAIAADAHGKDLVKLTDYLRVRLKYLNVDIADHIENPAHAPDAEQMILIARENRKAERDAIRNFLFTKKCGFELPAAEVKSYDVRRSHSYKNVEKKDASFNFVFQVPADSAELTSPELYLKLAAAMKKDAGRYAAAKKMWEPYTKELDANKMRSVGYGPGMGKYEPGPEMYTYKALERSHWANNINGHFWLKFEAKQSLNFLAQGLSHKSNPADALLYLVDYVNAPEFRADAYFNFKETINRMAREQLSMLGQSATSNYVTVPLGDGLQGKITAWQGLEFSKAVAEIATIAENDHAAYARLIAAVEPLPASTWIRRAIWQAGFPPEARGLFEKDEFKKAFETFPRGLCRQLNAIAIADPAPNAAAMLAEAQRFLKLNEDRLPAKVRPLADESPDVPENIVKASLKKMVEAKDPDDEAIAFKAMPGFGKTMRPENKEGVDGVQRYLRWRTQLPKVRTGLLDDLAVLHDIQKAGGMKKIDDALKARITPSLKSLLDGAARKDEDNKVGLVRRAIERMLGHLDGIAVSESASLSMEVNRAQADPKCRYKFEDEIAARKKDAEFDKSLDKYAKFLAYCHDSSARKWKTYPVGVGKKKRLETYTTDDHDRTWYASLPGASQMRLYQMTPEVKAALDFVIDFNTTWGDEKLRKDRGLYCELLDPEARRIYGLTATAKVAVLKKEEVSQLVLNPSPAAIFNAIFRTPELRDAYLAQFRASVAKDGKDALAVKLQNLAIEGVPHKDWETLVTKLPQLSATQHKAVRAFVGKELTEHRKRLGDDDGKIRLLALLANLPYDLSQDQSQYLTCNVMDPSRYGLDMTMKHLGQEAGGGPGPVPGAPDFMGPVLPGGPDRAELEAHFLKYLSRDGKDAMKKLPEGWQGPLKTLDAKQLEMLEALILKVGTDPDLAKRKLPPGWDRGDLSKLSEADRKKVEKFAESVSKITSTNKAVKEAVHKRMEKQLPELVWDYLKKRMEDPSNYSGDNKRLLLPESWDKEFRLLSEAQRQHVEMMTMVVATDPTANPRAIPIDWGARFKKLGEEDLRHLARLEYLLTKKLPAEGVEGTVAVFDFILQNLSSSSIHGALRVFDGEYQQYFTGHHKTSAVAEKLRLAIGKEGQIPKAMIGEFIFVAKSTLAARAAEKLKFMRPGDGGAADQQAMENSLDALFGPDATLPQDQLWKKYQDYRKQFFTEKEQSKKDALVKGNPLLNHMLGIEEEMRNGALRDYLEERQKDGKGDIRWDSLHAFFRGAEKKLGFNADEKAVIEKMGKILDMPVGHTGALDDPRNLAVRAAMELKRPQWRKDYCDTAPVQDFAAETWKSWTKHRSDVQGDDVSRLKSVENCMKGFFKERRKDERSLSVKLGAVSGRLNKAKLRLVDSGKLVEQLDRLSKLSLPRPEFEEFKAEFEAEKKAGKMNRNELQAWAMRKGSAADMEAALKKHQTLLARVRPQLAQHQEEMKKAFADFELVHEDIVKQTDKLDTAQQAKLEQCQAATKESSPQAPEDFIKDSFEKRFGTLEEPKKGNPYMGNPYRGIFEEQHRQFMSQYVDLQARAVTLAKVLSKEKKGVDAAKKDALYERFVVDVERNLCGKAVDAVKQSFADELARLAKADAGREERMAKLAARLRTRWNITLHWDKKGLVPETRHATVYPHDGLTMADLKADFDELTELMGEQSLSRAAETGDLNFVARVDFWETFQDQLLADFVMTGNSKLFMFSAKTAASVKWNPTTREPELVFQELAPLQKQVADTVKALEKEFVEHSKFYSDYRAVEDQWPFMRGHWWRGLFGGDPESAEQKAWEGHEKKMGELLAALPEFGSLTGGADAPASASDMLEHYKTQWDEKVRFDHDYLKHELYEDGVSRTRQAATFAATIAASVALSFVPGGQGLAVTLLVGMAKGMMAGIRFHHYMGVSQSAVAHTLGWGQAAQVSKGEMEQFKTGAMFSLNAPLMAGWGGGFRALGANMSTQWSARIATFAKATEHMVGMGTGAFLVDTAWNRFHEGKDWNTSIAEGAWSGALMAGLGLPPFSHIPGLRWTANVGSGRLGFFMKGAGRMMLYDQTVLALETHLGPHRHEIADDMQEKMDETGKSYLEVYWDKAKETMAKNAWMYVQSGIHGLEARRQELLRRDLERLNKPLSDADRARMTHWAPDERPDVLTLDAIVRMHGESAFGASMNGWFGWRLIARRFRGITPSNPQEQAMALHYGRELLKSVLGDLSYAQLAIRLQNEAFRDQLARLLGVTPARLMAEYNRYYELNPTGPPPANGAAAEPPLGWWQRLGRRTSVVQEALDKILENCHEGITKDLAKIAADVDARGPTAVPTPTEISRYDALIQELRNFGDDRWIEYAPPASLRGQGPTQASHARDAAIQIARAQGFDPLLFLTYLRTAQLPAGTSWADAVLLFEISHGMGRRP